MLEDEKNIYEREKNDLTIENAGDDKIGKIDDIIADIKDEIVYEKDKIDKAKKMVSANNQWLDEFTVLKESLTDLMAKEFNQKQTIDSFTQKEIKRLNNELVMLKEEKSELKDAQQKINKQKNKINKELASIDNEIVVVSNSELTDLLDQKSQLEMEEALLSEQESALKKSIEAKEQTDLKAKGERSLTLLEELEVELNNRRNEIESIKHEIASERQTLAEMQAEIDTKKAKKSGTLKYIGILIIVGLLVISGLFYLGRRRRLKKTGTK